MNERQDRMMMNNKHAGAGRPVTVDTGHGAALRHGGKGRGMSGLLRGVLVAVMAVVFGVAGLVASAEAATYYLQGDTTTNLGADGTANLPTIQSTGTTIPYRGTIVATPATATSWRPTNVATGTKTLIRGYSPVYASDVTISAISASLGVRSNDTGYVWALNLYDYNPTTGTKIQIASSPGGSVNTAGTTEAVVPGTFTIMNGGIVSAGHHLMMEIVHTSTAASAGERVYYGGTTGTTGSWVTLTETTCTPTGTLGVTAAQTLNGTPVDLTSITSASNATNLLYTVIDNTGAGSGTSTYNGATAGSLFYDENNTLTAMPATLAPSTALTGAEMTNISSDNGTNYANLGSFGDRNAVRMALPVAEAPATIDSLVVTYNGTGEAALTLQTHVWNYTTSAWQQFGNTMTINTTDTTATATYVRAGGFADFVSGGVMNILVIDSTNANLNWNVDYLKLDVNWTIPPVQMFQGNATAAQTVATAGWVDGRTYTLTLDGDDTTCGTPLTQANGTFVWNACTETATVNVTDPGAITGPTVITVTLGGSGGSAAQWSADGGTNWYNSGSQYTPPSCASGAVTFIGRATGACGTITDPTPVNQNYNTTDGDVATLTTTAPSGTVSGTVTVQVQVGVESTPASMTGMSVTIAGSDACNVAGAAMSWNAGSSRWEYNWNTAACGTSAIDGGVTINVTGNDPDCNTVVNGGQVTVSIDNSCVETGTVTASISPDPGAGDIAGATTVTANLGGGASNGLVRWRVNAGAWGPWQASPATFTPTSNSAGTVDFEAMADGSCGASSPVYSTMVSRTYDTRVAALEPTNATAVQNGTAGIKATFVYCNDKNATGTFKVEWKLASSGTWPPANVTTAVDGGAFDSDATLNEYVVVLIAGLTAGETYDVRMTFIDGTDGLTGAQPAVWSAAVTLVSWTDGPMLHNALRFACSVAGYSDETSCTDNGGTWNLDRKWTGGWGTPSGQYGAFQCGTCHQKNSSNIKRVITPVVAQTGSFPGSTVNLQSTVDGSSDFGNDAGGHATSTRVCEVCHSKTSYHRYDTNAAPAQTDLGHYNQADCFKCHEHQGGFRASCTACHGNPPTSDAELVYNLNAVNDTGSRTWGEHSVHVGTRGYDCNTCHNGWESSGEMPKAGNINIGFNAFGKPAGTYNGRTVGNGGKYTASGTTVNLTMASGTTTCAFYCHGYQVPQWNPTSTAACGACHGEPGSYGDDRAGAPTGVGASRDLSGALTGYKVGKHANHLDDSIAATGDPCALCHSTFGYAQPTHVDGTVNVSLNAAAGASASFTAGAPGTCASLDCHGDAPWDSAASGGCDFCHGYPPNSTNNKHAVGVTAVNHDALGITSNHDQCMYCHGAKDNGTGVMTILATSVLSGSYTYVEATDHMDGKVTINGNNNATSADDAGYNTTNAGCDTAACHGNDATHRLTTGGAGNVQLRDFGPGKCSTCHDTGVDGAPVVTSASTHTRVTTGGAFGDCTNCHSGHYTKAGGVQIPNNATIGINYVKTGHGGIKLGGPGTAVNINGVATADLDTQTTEAQICWTCHDAQTVKISEWGTNTKQTGAPAALAAYNYGTVSTPNWTTATWTSAQSTLFAYKTGAIQSTHSANSAGTSTVTATAGYYAETKDSVANIRCSYCHDVHDSYGTSGKPYLRGTWWTNPYKEDGAPTGAWNYYGFTENFGAVPRGYSDTATEYDNALMLGGWQIDQNNNNPTTAAGYTGVNWTTANSAGLCILCHTADANQNYDWKTGEALWVGAGHSNVVIGGTGAQKSNIYSPTTRNEGTTYTSPKMGYQMNGGGGADGSRMYGLRNYDGNTQSTASTNITTDNNTGVFPYAAAAGGSTVRYAYSANGGFTATSVWGVDQSTTTAQSKYHNFSCSKCHNPHASRLPKLMITNCLDVSHNTWDDNFSGDPDWASGEANGTVVNWSTVGIFPTGTETAGNNKEFAYAKSAINCHRFIDNNGNGTITTGDAGGDEPGWNKATPWK